MGYVNIGKGKFIQSRTAKRYEILNHGSGVIIRKLKTEKQEIPESYVVRAGNANPTEQAPVAVDQIALKKASEKAAAPAAAKSQAVAQSGAAVPPASHTSPIIPSSKSFAELQRNIEESNRREAARREEIRRKAAEMKQVMAAEEPAKTEEPVVEAAPEVEQPVMEATPEPVMEAEAPAEVPANDPANTPAVEEPAEEQVEEPAAVETAQRKPITDDDLVPLDKKALQALHKSVLGKTAGKDVTKNELRKRILAGLENASEEALAEVYKAIEG